MNNQFTEIMTVAAKASIPTSKGRENKVLVSWWTEECQTAGKERNKAFQLFQRTLNMQTLIAYKKAVAVVRRTVRWAKRRSWRLFCSKIGRTTPAGDVWSMVRRMGGDLREWDYPVIVSGQQNYVTDQEKAEVMVQTFAKVHSTDNLSVLEKDRRNQTKALYPEGLVRQTCADHSLMRYFLWKR